MLRNYRAMPHATTGATPAELLFQRKLRIKLPEQPSKPDTSHDAIRTRDTARKQQIKCQSDSRTHTTPSDLAIGDRLLVRQRRGNKVTPHNDPRPYSVMKQKGSMITACCGRHWITRNSSHFKKVTPTIAEGQAVGTDNTDDSSDDDDDNTPAQQQPAPMAPKPPTPRAVSPAPARRYPARDRRPTRFFMDYTFNN